MALMDAELFMQAMDVAPSHWEALEAALRRLPGVQFVSQRVQEGPSAEVCVQIAFDPEVTNPVAIKEALGHDGFTVLSARASSTADESVGGVAR
jgi:hypothetical protein